MNSIPKPCFKMIVAMSKNRAIGKDNTMPWHLSSDLKRFKALTTGHTILMGKHTFESLPVRPLKNRRNIVVSTSLALSPQYEVARSLDEAFTLCSQNTQNTQNAQGTPGAQGAPSASGLSSASTPAFASKEVEPSTVYIIGGANLYSQCMDRVDQIMMTVIDQTFEGDRFFPELDESWIILERSGLQHDEKSGLDFEYITYSRKK